MAIFKEIQVGQCVQRIWHSIFLITVYLQVLFFFKFKYKYLQFIQSSLNEEYMPEPHVSGYAAVLLIVLIPITFNIN
jgi:hypothetical protein